MPAPARRLYLFSRRGTRHAGATLPVRSGARRAEEWPCGTIPGARQPLRTGTGGGGAAFREGQGDAIRRVVEGSGRLLPMRRTGWGKSFICFIAAKPLRKGGAGRFT